PAAPNTATASPAGLATLAALPPQLALALQSLVVSNDSAEAPSKDPLSDSYRRAHLTFTPDQRPLGTAGRGEFNLQVAIRLDDFDYELFLRTVRNAVTVCNFDPALMLSFQDSNKKSRARTKIKRALPGLAVYATCEVPYWPVEAGLHVIVKAMVQSHQRRQARLANAAAALAAAQAAANNPVATPVAAPDTAVNPAPAPNTAVAPGPALQAAIEQAEEALASSEDEDEIGNNTIASIHEMENPVGEEEEEEEEESPSEEEEEEEGGSSEEMAENAPFANPPAYNSAKNDFPT
ncbi:hypothetical protein FRC12_018269, partial [Ceratobasidium sp. 428]